MTDSKRFFVEHGTWHDLKTGKHLHDIVTDHPASDRLGVLLNVLSGHDQTHDEAMAELEADGVDVDAFLDGLILATQGPTP